MEKKEKQEFLELAYSKEELGNIIVKNRMLGIEKRLGIKLVVKENKLVINKTKCKLNDFELMNMLDAWALCFKKEAFLLEDPDWLFEKINLRSMIRPARLKTVRARIIGKKGKTKRVLQELTNCYFIISKNHIGIIGKQENMHVAKRAIERLIRGKRHEAVYSALQREAREIEEKQKLTEEQLKEIEEE
ncbi:MAG: KH domain-containing protein [Candidatus Pacearchaeota archaeon]